jgi:hypothetical protein
LAEFGTPRFLRGCGGWILERDVPGSSWRDAMGCYPLFLCNDWSRLAVDLQLIQDELLCLSVVTDPLGDYDERQLRECFIDVFHPFKNHYVVDLKRDFESHVSSHHRRNSRKALKQLVVNDCANPSAFLDDWTALYGTLRERHNLSRISAFSRDSFATQLSVPGLVSFRAVENETIVGMVLWYVQKRKVYYHLGAYSPRGYELLASFALFDYSIRYFASRGFEWLNLGAEAGIKANQESGLSRFKQGWSTGMLPTYFCGRIFKPQLYRELVESRKLPPTTYFPAYRHGEFN